jgi:hypothetical protein
MATKKGPVSSNIPICIGPTEILLGGKAPSSSWFVRSGVANETLVAAGGEHVLARADKGVAAVSPRRMVERRTMVEENMVGSRNDAEVYLKANGLSQRIAHFYTCAISPRCAGLT